MSLRTRLGDVMTLDITDRQAGQVSLGTSVAVPGQPFGGPVAWDLDAVVLVVAADRTLESALRRIHEEEADWVVVVRPVRGSLDVYYYAFRPAELVRVAAVSPQCKLMSLELAMTLSEGTSSGTARGGRPIGRAAGWSGPASTRIVAFNATGRVTAVGEREDLTPHPGGLGIKRGAPEDSFDLGPMRSVALEAKPPPAADIDVTLSAETDSEINVGATARVLFQIELSSEPISLAHSISARARKDVSIVVSLSVENDAVEILRAQECTVDPPANGEPRTGFFVIKGARPGTARLAVAFRQAGSDLGVISLALEVVQAGAAAEKARGEVIAAPRVIADDDKLALLVEQRVEGAQVFYEYTLHSEALGLPYRKVRSRPLLDGGGGPAATALAFVKRIYER
ncbi:MAG TPA: TCAD7 domain-containing protein, partial [Steroidobacteraceae bacterium]